MPENSTVETLNRVIFFCGYVIPLAAVIYLHVKCYQEGTADDPSA